MRPLALSAGLCAAIVSTSLPAVAQETAPRASPPAEALSAVVPYDCNFAQKLTLGPGVCAERQALAIRRRVGEMIGEGRCDQATAEARKTGDAGFAGRVQSACEQRRTRLAAQH